MRINRKYLILVALAAAIVAIDQASKLYIHTQYRLGETTPVLQNYFNITYVRNLGAAFGMFRETPEWFRKNFFLLMPPTAMIIIMMILRTVADRDRVQIFALSAVFGGALGNYIDRLRLGYVVDFLDFHWHNYYTWPAFNIADSAIVVGSTILGILIFLQWLDERSQKKPKVQAKEST